MPVIKTFRSSGRFIEDFEEFCTPEFYPLFSSVDYAEEASEIMDKIEEKDTAPVRPNKNRIPSFWKKYLFFYRTAFKENKFR